MRQKVVWNCRLKQLRLSAGLSLRDLERATGVTNATISNAERGADLNLTTARALAAHFRLTVEQVWPELAGSEKSPPAELPDGVP